MHCNQFTIGMPIKKVYKTLKKKYHIMINNSGISAQLLEVKFRFYPIPVV